MLACVVLTGCRARPPAEPAAAIFREAAVETGLQFHHFTGATGQFYMPEIMGSGIAVLDYDGDGDLDIFLAQGTILEPGKALADARFPPTAGWTPGNRLFRNQLRETGRLQFVDVTAQSGLAHDGYSMGVAAGDYNNDGYPDLYVTGFPSRNAGSSILYRNNGNGTFTNVTREAGLEDSRWSASASFIDYDRDGYLDLYVTHYLDFTVRGNKPCVDATGERDYCTPNAY